MGYQFNHTLTLSKYDGTQIFTYEFSPEEDAGGISVVWFEEDEVQVYAVRTNTIMSFSTSGELLEVGKTNDVEYNTYDDMMKDFRVDFARESIAESTF